MPPVRPDPADVLVVHLLLSGSSFMNWVSFFLWQPCRLLANPIASVLVCVVGASVLVQAEDPDLPAFYFDPVINPISAFRSTRQTGWEEEEDDDGDWEVSYITRPLGLRQHVIVALWYKKLFMCQSSSHNSHLLSQKRKMQKKNVAASLPFWPPTGVCGHGSIFRCS